MNNIICIAGPTASGKTALAVALAKELNGEVVSCDSMQVYKRMDIGTAKPTLEEMQGIPHRMIDVAEPWEDFSVSRYCEMAAPIVDDILSRGKTAVIAGGTGLYMDSLVRGSAFAPFPATGVRERLEAQADAEGMEAMLSRLRAVDPDSAQRLHLSDRKRILRALEVYLETGETITEHNRKTQAVPPRYSPIWLGLDFAQRSELYRRIDLRVSLMLQQGLVEEIRGLLADGIPEKATAMQAIGYKEFVDALDGRCTIEEAADQVRQSSRRYAKRQLTWFRRNKAIHWLVREIGDTGREILENARRIVSDSDN
ncbi:MAG TPA: tRNA (adenosine(37)-N6)-dimethylallyltransferase MiaA [Clostridiales bacterium]|nr:tRNA (adenosine(37)-N6)-dimethylallyltransferase MiaA [Clostridiales bacterium]HCP70619.1 tRNA (adenosine(37)-N6)-dimethylallyltransferase MiaA [Clostridiales bacterium]